MTEHDEREEQVIVGVSRGGRRPRDRRVVAGFVMNGGASSAARLFFGVALIIYGLLWTTDNLGWTAVHDMLEWWPLLLLAFGVARLTGAGGMGRHVPAGVFFTVAGALLVIGRLTHHHVGIGILLPLLVIFAGVTLMRRAAKGEPAVTAQEQSGENLKLVAVMGAVTSRGTGEALRRGELCAVMGGIELDLRESAPASRRVDLEVCAAFGGVEIIVPETWRVESEVMPVAGGFEDRTSHPADAAAACTLALHGTALLGGIVVRNKPGIAGRVRVEFRARAGGSRSGAGAPPSDTPPPVEPR